MFIFDRQKPPTLLVMESLSHRMMISGKHEEYLYYLQKGHAAEVAYDGQLEEIGNQVVIFPGILLQPRLANPFQWDTIILAGSIFYLYEIKSFSGEYCYGEETWLSSTGFEISNPHIQMQDNKNRFTSLLRELGYGKEFQVKAYPTFVEPNFTLFHAPNDQPLLLPSQLKHHFADLKKGATPFTTRHHQVVADLLAHQRVEKVFRDHVPVYDFKSLRKGVRCPVCGSFELGQRRQTYLCAKCGHKDTIFSLLYFHINEVSLLFPNEKVTSKLLNHWCGGIYHQRRLKRALNKFYQGD
ncbi:nuclease-related domain-containing protein [Jeotgalibaca caeni]|uniref:nuclease-related domain-containing protein n=1 Tax=Jeotgalibaca caeni TaxID=3028623 RepID=UPI00237E656C|nr:nuclease-related domain-containing protein [Jeotgalibaca caeni]MDE1549104.1 nuclease-related domain-containing protein [Jeotgalibaca caeni]